MSDGEIVPAFQKQLVILAFFSKTRSELVLVEVSWFAFMGLRRIGCVYNASSFSRLNIGVAAGTDDVFSSSSLALKTDVKSRSERLRAALRFTSASFC